MNSLFKFSVLFILILSLNSCISFSKDEADQQQIIPSNPINLPHIVKVDNINYFRAPDGTIYMKGQIYRDVYGRLYEQGQSIGMDYIVNQPGIVVRNGSVNVDENSGFLPAVDFDKDHHSTGVPEKRSGANSGKPTGNGKNIEDPRNKRSGSNTTNLDNGGFKK
jgi:hypothetical protein